MFKHLSADVFCGGLQDLSKNDLIKEIIAIKKDISNGIEGKEDLEKANAELKRRRKCA